MALPEVIKGLFEAVAVDGAGEMSSEEGNVEGPARLAPWVVAADPAGVAGRGLKC